MALFIGGDHTPDKPTGGVTPHAGGHGGAFCHEFINLTTYGEEKMENETIDGKGMNQMSKSLTDVDRASLKRPWQSPEIKEHDFRETALMDNETGGDMVQYGS
jgi:hypothetical protein